MEHVAIDLGSRESQVCRRDAQGKILETLRLRNVQLESYLEARKERPARVILETCSEAFHLADVSVKLGYEVRVVPATLVRSLGVGARGIKTDERDAALLSQVSCRIDLPSVHIPSVVSRDLKALSASRERLVDARTMLVNNVRGWLRTQAIPMPGRSCETFPTRVRLTLGESVPVHLERTLETIELLNGQIRVANKELVALTKNDLCERLMTVPGVGPVTAIRFIAAIDVAGRFPNARAVRSYVGLTPGERSSGTVTRRTGITKAGAAALRGALVQAAWSAMYKSKKHQYDPMIQWALRLRERRNSCIAAVALARKLSGILYAIWRDGGRYDLTRGAKRAPAKKTG
jgi:transposase